MYINETGKSQQVLDFNGRVEKLLYHDTEDGLIIVGVGLNLSYYSAESDGTLNEITTVSLAVLNCSFIKLSLKVHHLLERLSLSLMLNAKKIRLIRVECSKEM